MYEKDGIMYAGNIPQLPRVVGVRPLPDYRLFLEFSNGERRIKDMSKELDCGVFLELKDREAFESVRASHGTIEWSNGADYCPDSLYETSTIVKEGTSPLC